MRNEIQPRSLMRKVFNRLASLYADEIALRIEARVEERLVHDMHARIEEVLSKKPWNNNIFLPPIAVHKTAADKPFMNYSTCSAADFYHPRFSEIAAEMGIPAMLHRKFWEWAYIVHIAQSRGVVAPGKRALGFGVGTERMPALFTKGGMLVTATDAPQSVDDAQGWSTTGQFSNGIAALPYQGILDQATFLQRVSFEECDMNAINAGLQDYDFCWSSCALEHLGDLRRGFDFIINSVEKTLKIGGIACHTTEFNLSSNDTTVESGPTVLYRRKDFEELIAELRARGHIVDELTIAPDSHHLDGYVDTPPYIGPTPQTGPAHLKLDLYGYTCTSVGITVQRGR